jgi:hypothetical protein
MKHVKLFESWMESANSEDISKFALDTSTEEESVFVINLEDSIYSVLGDPETCMKLQELALKIDEQGGLYRSMVFNQPGTSFIGMDGHTGAIFAASNVVERPEGTNIWVLTERGGAIQLGEDGTDPRYFFYPVKRGDATVSRQATTFGMISIDELVEVMNEMAGLYPAQ